MADINFPPSLVLSPSLLRKASPYNSSFQNTIRAVLDYLLTFFLSNPRFPKAAGRRIVPQHCARNGHPIHKMKWPREFIKRPAR